MESKSETIRSLMRARPDLKPAQIRDHLALHGINVDTHLIRVVRANSKLGRSAPTTPAARKQRHPKADRHFGGAVRLLENPGELVHADAAVALGDVAPDSVALTVTSPPFDDTFENGTAWDRSKWESIARHLWRATKPGGVVAWQVRDQILPGRGESGTSHLQVAYFLSLGFILYQTIYSQSNCYRRSQRRYARTVTPVYVFAKGRPDCVNLLRDRPNKMAGMAGRVCFREPDGRIRVARKGVVAPLGFRGDLWSYRVGYNGNTLDHYAYEHSCVMHEGIARDLILSFSNEGDVVLDPLGGTGTTAKMAVLTGRRFLSIEVVEVYHEIARRRVEEAMRRVWSRGPSTPSNPT